MHSHTVVTCLFATKVEVLILVLMEDALALLETASPEDKVAIVLILVLMEDALALQGFETSGNFVVERS